MDAELYSWTLLALIAAIALIHIGNGHQLDRITRELRRGRRQAAAVQGDGDEGTADERDQGPGDPEAASSAFLRWPGDRGPRKCRQ